MKSRRELKALLLAGVATLSLMSVALKIIVNQTMDIMLK